MIYPASMLMMGMIIKIAAKSILKLEMLYAELSKEEAEILGMITCKNLGMQALPVTTDYHAGPGQTNPGSFVAERMPIREQRNAKPLMVAETYGTSLCRPFNL
ncbi:MAG: hypothetical protein PHY92_06155 [Alphaproteobacteria bacterium]|nr:hypothetical protein [Alphaproteobacteria bacterium]